MSLTLENQLRNLLTELKNLKLLYEKKDEKNKDNNLIRQGRYEAYRYCESKLAGILDWMDIEH